MDHKTSKSTHVARSLTTKNPKTSPTANLSLTRQQYQVSSPNFLTWLSSLVARLLIWYALFIIIFRCPATLDACNDSFPPLCRPYLQAKTHISPHIKPYYDTYALHYVELARPYCNSVSQSVISPAWQHAVTHVSPKIDQAQALIKFQWDEKIQPHVARYQDVTKHHYDERLGPHVDRWATAMAPYYDMASTNARQTYHDVLLPSGELLAHTAAKLYAATSSFATRTAVPTTIWVWNKTYAFLDAAILPRLKVVYMENVEPQLVKITHRLGRFNGKPASRHQGLVEQSPSAAKPGEQALTPSAPPTRVASAAHDDATPASSTSSASSASASADRMSKPGEQEDRDGGDDDKFVDTLAPAAPKIRSSEPVTPHEFDDESKVNDKIRSAREIVAADLRDWQKRYAKAADEGAAEIASRVAEISKKMMAEQGHNVGRPLVSDLRALVNTEMDKLRRTLLDLLRTAKKQDAAAASVKEEAATQDITAAVRTVGLAIRQKAHEVRAWREKYQDVLQSSVTQAAQSHFRILDSIRDLALQKIGMKWAWTDGITYHDWAKFHELRRRFQDWQTDLGNVIVAHPGLEAAQGEGADIEDEAMKLAQAAAHELARLKQVTLWKLAARDDSADFDDSEAARQAAEAASHRHEAPARSTPLHDLLRPVEDTAAAAAADAHIDEAVAESADHVAEHAAPEDNSAFDIEEPASHNDNDVEIDKGPSDEPSLASVKPAFLGAAAESVPNRQLVLDVADDGDDNSGHGGIDIVAAAAPALLKPDVDWARIELIASSRLNEARAWAEQQYESAQVALGLPTPVPTPSSASEHVVQMLENARHNYYADLGLAHARYSDFLVAASSALDALTATPTPSPTDLAGSLSSVASIATSSAAAATTASAASVAREQDVEGWEAVVNRVSLQIYSAPTPTPRYSSLANATGDCAARVSDAAAEKYAMMLDAAAQQYLLVSDLVSELLVGKEHSFTESIYSRLSLAYATGAASAASLASPASETVMAAAEHVVDTEAEATEAVKEQLALVTNEMLHRDEL